MSEMDYQSPDGRESRDAIRKARAQIVARAEEYITQGVKGATVLNAGGIVAMLGFAQALVGKDAFGPIKVYALVSTTFYLVGAILAAVIFAFRYMSEALTGVDDHKSGLYGRRALFSIFVSLGFFVLGTVTVGLGICRNL